MVTAAGKYDLRRLRHGRCGGLGVMALLAPAVAPTDETIKEK